MMNDVTGSSKKLDFVDTQDVLNFLGELMADYVDREQNGKADLVGDTIKLLVERSSHEPPAPASEGSTFTSYSMKVSEPLTFTFRAIEAPQPFLTLHNDGRITVGEHVTGDEAAMRFLDALRFNFPGWIEGLRATLEPGDECAWVIEMTAAPQPLYFSDMKGGAFPYFDRDHMRAIRFTRKQDAEAALQFLHGVKLRDPETGHHYTPVLAPDCYAVTEHMWCSTATKGVTP